MHVSRGESRRPISHTRRGNWTQRSPKIWWIVGKANNPQTPNVARSSKWAGLQLSTGSRGATPKHCFNIWALAHPYKQPTIAEPRVARWPEWTSSTATWVTRLANMKPNGRLPKGRRLKSSAEQRGDPPQLSVRYSPTAVSSWEDWAGAPAKELNQSPGRSRTPWAPLNSI
jgi:hypothetical protein